MWAIKSGIVFASGLGLGGGEMIGITSKMSHHVGPLKTIQMALDNFGVLIAEEKCATNNYVTPGIPRWFFVQAANASFCKGNAKKNGLTTKQLYYQIP